MEGGVEAIEYGFEMIDRVPGAYAAGQHLASFGHQRVDYFEPTFNRDYLVASESMINSILTSLKAGMNGKGEVGFYTTPVEALPGWTEIEANGFSVKSMYEIVDVVIERYLDCRSGASAVIVANTMVAWRLIGLMRKRGMQCPRDLSVVPFAVALPMTALEYSTERMARKAISSILAVKAGQKVANAIKVPTVLVARDSTAPPAR